jgi:large repetitive protein
MASFPDLRPSLPSATAESKGLRRFFRSPLILAVSAALLLTAFFAVSELATLRGAKAHDASAYLTRLLGPPLDSARLVRKPGRDIKVEVGKRDGLSVTHAGVDSITLAARGAGHAGWRHYANGVNRSTPFGSETITVGPGQAEQFLTVTRKQGKRTWQWNLGTNLKPKSLSNGSVELRRAGSATPEYQVLPVSILDGDGKNVTPAGSHWKLKKNGASWRLLLTLDDAKLPTPYVIDPAIVFDAVSGSGNNASNTLTWNHTVANQPNRMLIVAYNSENTGTASCQPTSVTYNGVAMNLAGQTVANNPSPNWDCVGIYYLANPANGLHAVTINFTGVTPTNDSISATAMSVYSVSQNAPDVVASSQAAGLTSTNITTLWPNSWVVDGIGLGDLSGTLAVSAGQTSRRIQDSTGSNSTGMSSKLVAAAGSTTMSWTRAPAPNRSGQVVIALSQLDNTAPAAPTITPSESDAFTYVTGTTVFYNAQGANSGSFTVDATSSDADSGIKKINFPAVAGMAGGGDDLTSPYQGTYNWTAATAASGAQTVTVTNGQNLTSTGTFTVTRDITNPTGSLTAPASSANVNGSTVAVSSNSADAGSGVASAQFQYSVAGAGSWNNIGAADTTAPYSVNWDTTALTDGLYDLRVVTTDNVSNSFTSPLVTNVRVDNTKPTNAMSLQSVSPAGSAFLSGTTVYYRGAAAGNFQLRNTVTDAGSGPASSVFPVLGGTVGTWTHTTQTVNTPAGGPYTTTNNFAWSAGETNSPTESITSTDTVGNTSNATVLTFTNDSTNPTGAVTAPAASANVSGAAVTVSSNSADPGSGVASAQFQRSPAGAGTWTNIGAADTTSPYSVAWDTTAVADGLYDLRVITIDNVGNTFTSGVITNVRVDNTKPTQSLALQSVSPAGSAFQSGTTVYYRGAAAGNFQLQNTVTDGGSGPASATFPALGGTVGTWTHTVQTLNTPAGGPYTTTNNFAWSAGETNSPTESATSADAAGNTSNATVLTFTNDSTAPTGAVTAPAASANVSGAAVTVSSNSADPGSGVASAQFQRSPAGAGTWTNIGAADTTSPYSVSWDTTAVADGLYDLRVITTDNVGNTFTSAVVTNVTVDNTKPTNSISVQSASPAGAVFQNGNTIWYRGAAAGNFQLRNTVSDSGSGPASGIFPALGGTVGTWTHTTQTVNTPAGGPYTTTNNFAWSAAETNSPTESITSTDNSGNTSNATGLTFSNDSTNPTGTVTAPAASANVSGTTVAVSSSDAADGGSGLASVQFQRSPAGAGTWTNIGAADTTAPYSVSWDTTAVADGLYDLRAVMTDNVGNTLTTATVANVRVDNTKPTNSIALQSVSPAGSAFLNGNTVYYRGTAAGNFQLQNTVSDAGSGPASSVFPALGGTVGTWTHTTQTVNAPAGGPYTTTNNFAWSAGETNSPTESVTSTDNSGNTSNVTGLTFTNDSGNPTGSVTAPAASANVSGSSVTVSSTDAADAGSGLASVQFQRSPAGAGTWTNIGAADTTAPYSVNWDTTALSDGLYDLRAVMTDNVGNTLTTATVANVRVDNTKPTNAMSVQSASPAGAVFQNGNTIWYRGAAAGNFQLRNTVTDAGSGPASSVFPALGGTVGTWTHTTQTVNAPAGGPYTTTNNFAWSAGETNSPTESVTSTDNAGNTSNAAVLTFSNDSTNPTGSITAPAASANVSGSAVTVSSTDAADGGSGLASVQFQRSPAGAGTWTNIGAADTTSPYSASWDTTALSDGLYDLRAVVTDNVGNTLNTATVANVRVDNTKPTNAMSLQSASPAGSAVLNGNTVYYRGTAAGNFQLRNTVADAGSGPASGIFPALGGTVGTWTHTAQTVNAPAGGPYTTTNNFAWAAGESSSPTESITSTDNAGNTSSATLLTFTNDSTNPTGSVTAPAASANVSGSSVTVSSTDAADAGSGVASVQFQYSPAGFGAWTNIGAADATSPYSVNWDTTALTDGLYDLRAQITDNVGNTLTTATVASVRIDNTKPTNSISVQSASPSGAVSQSGNTIWYRGAAAGNFQLRNTVADAGSGPASGIFPALGGTVGTWTHTTQTVSTPAGGPYTTSNNFAWSAGETASPTESITSTDNAGNTSNATGLTFSNDSTAPSTTDNTASIGSTWRNTNATVTLTPTDAASGTATTYYTTDGSTPTTASAQGTSITLSATAVYTIKYFSVDNVGNTESVQTASTQIRIDKVAPTNSLSVSNVSGSSFLSGSTVWYRGVAAGSFRISNAVGDTGGSGPASSATAALGGTTTGWTHTPSTVSTPSGGPYDSNTFSWSAGTTSSPTEVVTAADTAGNTTAAGALTFSNDSTAPSGGALTVNNVAATAITPVSYDTDGSFPIDLRTDYTDGGGESGLASSTLVRTSATFSSADTCGAFASPVTIPGSPNQSGLATGCYKYTLTGTDNVGNTVSILTIVKVDTDNPNISLTNPGTPVGGTIALNATASDGTTGVTQVVFQRATAGGSTWTTIGSDSSSPYTTNWDTTSVSDGLYDVRAVATDTAGNSNTSVVANREVDNTAPNTSIDSSPNNPSNNTTPTFNFSSTESGSSFQCRLDGGSWSACTSPFTLSPALGAGSHTFDVRATDLAGNTDASPATYTWTIDLTAPNTTIDSQPASPSNNTTPTFSFSSTESGSTFQCRLDGGSWSACSSPNTISPALSEGTHTFDVRATDQAGNTDATPASYTWIVDTGAPSVSITSPTVYINAADPNNYSVAASTPDTDVTHVDFFECSNASVGCGTGTWNQFATDNAAPFQGTWTTPAFDGVKAIRAVAFDAAGNTGEHIRTITIDRTAPTNVTVTYPNGYVVGSYTITTSNGTDPDVNASAASLERRTGDLANDSCSGYGSWAAASSPDTLASGKCAQYRYSVADNAGNVALVSPSSEVKSDTAAPTSSLTDPGTNLRQTITLNASASDTDGSGLAAVAFERRPAGGGSWTTITSDSTSPYSTSFDTTTVADGMYDFRSVATDKAGNTESAPVVVANKRIDNTAPSATMLSPGNPVSGTVALTSNTSDTGGSGIATVAYELAPHSGSFNSQAASWDTTLVSDALYDLRVVATDVAGNTTTSAAITTRVDNTPPALTFSSPATGAVVSGTVNLTAGATDASPANPAVTFAYKLHSDPPSAYAATGASWNTTSLPGGDGLYDLRARATDDAGNTSSVENTSIRVDNAPPTISITAPAAAINGSLPSPTTFAATANDAGGSGVNQVQFFECTNQSNNCSTGVWSPLGTIAAPGPYSVSWSIPVADGNHALAAVATDNASHTSTAIRNVSVDRTAPNTTILTKPGDPSSDVVPSFTFSSTEPGSTFECSVDGGAFASCTSPKNISGLSDNSHTFAVRATDAAGNTDATPDSWTWHRDTNAPTAVMHDPGSPIRGTEHLTSTVNDPAQDGYHSDLQSASYEYSNNGTTWATIATNTSPPWDNTDWDTTLVADGVYQLRVVATDVAGNVTTSPAITNIRIDNTVPTTSQDDPGQYLRGTKILTGSAADTGSGVDHVDFERAPAGSGVWTLIGTDSTPGNGISTSFDTTGVADGQYDFRTVAVDVAGNQAASTAVTSRLVDNTAPAASLNDPGAYLRGAVNLSSTTSDPGGANASGIVSVAYEYTTNGGSTWQPTGATFNSTSVTDGNVGLHVVATDAAGNTTTSATVTKLADNTKPNTTDNAPSGWQSSPVTVNLSPSDAGSGVNVTEYSIDGNPTYTVGTSVAIPAPANGSNDGAHTIAYFSVDNAGNIETVKSATVMIDATPPACASCSAADYLRGTVSLSADPDPSGSGIKSVAFEYTDAGGSTWTTIGTDTTGPGPYTASWDTTLVPDGHYDLRIVITDNADNVTTTSLPDKVVDNSAPNVALVGAPTEGQLVTGTISISASASDVTSPIKSVKFYVRGSLLATDTTAPFAQSWDTTSGADGAATIYVVVEDMAGNAATSPVRNVTVDNVAPTPTLTDPGQFLHGTVSLSATSDADTAQVDFERRPAGGGAWVTIASDNTLPFATSLDTTALADGLYDFRAVATDGTGASASSPIRTNIRIDNTLPSGSLTSPAAGATVGGTNVALGGSYSDGGAGIASVSYELRPTGGGSFTPIASSTSSPFGATWDATTVATGSYDLRPVVTDRAGNVYTGPTVTFNVDVSAPTVTLTNPGATISGTVALNATVNGSGATQVVFGATPSGGGAWTSLGSDTSAPWSVSVDTTKLADGTYDLRATVTDSLGNTSSDVVAAVKIDNTAPRILSTSPLEGSTISSAAAIGFTTSEPVTLVGVTLDGGTAVAPVVTGTSVSYNTGQLGIGPHTLAGELQDSSGKKRPFRIHFTIWPSTSSTNAPSVEKNTSDTATTTLDSSDGVSSVTMPGGEWSSPSDWLVLKIAPMAPPVDMTNGFAPGPQIIDVTARWALNGTLVHQFSKPLNIAIDSTDGGMVPATLENGAWRSIARVPSAGTLPAGWDDGFYRDGNGVHILTKHLSQFAMLRDVEAPNPPQDVRGYAGPNGLTLSWTPGSDNSGTYDFVTLFSDSNDIGHYGVDYLDASVGGWSMGDTQVFRLKETDLAGNESGITAPLMPVPSLIGKTPDEAAAILAKLGFKLGTVTAGGTGPAGTISGPVGLVLAEQGATIDVTVATGGSLTKLAFKVTTAPKLRPAVRKNLAARVSVTRASRVTAELYSPRHVKLFTWKFSAKAGQSIVKLRLPRQVRRVGSYSMRWIARASNETATRALTIRFVKRNVAARPVVLLAGSAAGTVGNKLARKPGVVRASSVEPTFDAAANRGRNVRVIVVDIDQFGVSLIRDLHTVFPSVKIIGLTSRPKTMVAALRAGASVVLPRSTPSPKVARVVRRLLSIPAPNAKPRRASTGGWSLSSRRP